MQQLIVLTLLACFTVKSINAINCYSCESAYEPNCGYDFELEVYFQLNCSRTAPPRYLEYDLAYSNATACMKRVYKEQGVRKVMRSCFYGDVNETDIGCRMDPMLIDVDVEECLICDNENYCNGVTAVAETEWPAKLALIAFVIVAKFLNIKLS